MTPAARQPTVEAKGIRALGLRTRNVGLCTLTEVGTCVRLDRMSYFPGSSLHGLHRRWHLGPKLGGVIGCPFEERLWGCSNDFRECGGNVRGLADGGGPGVKQHIHGGQRPNREQLTARLVWRDLFDARRAAEHAADRGYLLELAQRLRSGQNIFRSGVSVLTQRADCDRCDVTLVYRRCRSG